ncbi:D-arabinono-1,4-lactone oxidase [Archangium sp.]|uniref:D-arabinono-1,4-lactone oxidase n=1 Tax=Archangium sp. TaxID=1872627 RepID=UPI00389A4822
MPLHEGQSSLASSTLLESSPSSDVTLRPQERDDGGVPRFEHPRTEGEIILLVKRARALGVQLRVRGAQHCKPRGAIYTDKGSQHINVQLDYYNRILHWDEARMRVTVQAGCHLGVDPNNPLSTKKNSLLWQLDQKGWALPDLGGITHQTVAGFLSTGSMGGTIHHDLGGAIAGIRLIDGTGRVHELAPNPEDPEDERNNPFYAAGVSLGLLGVISTVTLQCEPRYDIEGRQVTSPAGKCDISLFDPGGKGLQRYWEENEQGDTYTRLLWLPQKGVDKVELWTAHRAGDERKWLRCLVSRRFKRRPFVSVPRVFQWLIIHPFYKFIAEEGLPYVEATERLVRRVLNLFSRDGVKTFRDSWFQALPMDNGVSDKHLPTVFTEMFFDLEQTARVLEVLHKYFNPCSDESEALKDAAGMGRTGSFAFEIYPGHRSRFWMSPSYKRHSCRLDVFWFHTKADRATREAFFERFWGLMRQEGIDFRVHWGKYLPPVRSAAGAEYLRSQYPMWGRFMQVRKRMDPDGIFLSTYWKEHLGVFASVLDRPEPSQVLALPASGTGPMTLMQRGKAAASGLRTTARRHVRHGRLYVSVAVLKLVFGVIDLVRGRPDGSGDSTTEQGA